MSYPKVIDILKMELDQKLPYWLSPQAKNRERMDKIVAKYRAAYFAKLAKKSKRK